MKKRIISLLMMLVMCISLVAPNEVSAATPAKEETKIDNWALVDLNYAVTYGIYPYELYQSDLTKSITLGKLYRLIGGVRGKIAESNCAKEKGNLKLRLTNKITVEDVLNAFYSVISDYEYTSDIGLDSKVTPVDYMKKYNIYTGHNGEQALTDTCTYEQAIVIGERVITYLYNALGAASKGFMWQIKSGGNNVYLLGSIHLASYSTYPFSASIMQKFVNSDGVYEEVNYNDKESYAAFQELAVYADGTTLKDHVSADTYKKTMEVASSFGLAEEIAKYYKPWFLYLFIENCLVSNDNNKKEEIVANLGIDMMFTAYATLFQKPLYAIEGLKKQAEMLDSFSPQLQEYLLNGDVDAAKDMLNGTATDDSMDANDYVSLMLKYWHDGNIEGFSKMSSQDDADVAFSDKDKELAKEYKEKLLVQRDKGMADYIDGLLKTDGNHNYFVIVGSAHYISDYSVLDRLEKMGYKVEVVK